MLREKIKLSEQSVLLGKGAFSEVYRVMDRGTGRLSACKVSSRIEAAEREAALLARINHPLFPEYRGSFQQENRHYLMMECISGTELGQYVRRRGGISQKRAVQIAMELAGGLNYLHEQSESLIFRDVKPENVMIQQDGKVRLVDLGCVCAAGDENGVLAGSHGYSAPEQFERGGKTGTESDVYALGMLLRFMLGGYAPANNKERIVIRHRRRKISRGLERLIGQCIQENQSQRIPDMRTFMQRLAIYEEENILRRFWTCRRRFGIAGKSVSFHYQKNIRKGL